MLPHEWVLSLTLSILPPLVVIASLLTIKMFVFRYVEWAAIGLAIVAAAGLFHITKGNPAASGCVLLLLIAVLGAEIAIPLVRARKLIEGEAINHELADVPAEPVPILIANTHVYMELAYYADPKVRGRLAYALSLELERRYTRSDTAPLILPALRERVPLQIPDYKDFMASHRRFLLAANDNDWLVWHLIASGYRVVPPHERQWSPGVFMVQAPDAAGR
jgi:hypothetical protein